MLLHVMRHGPAEDRAPTGRDFDRVLTRSGRAVVERAASLLVARGVNVPRVLSSPYPRARETAAIVRSLLSGAEPSFPPVELRDELAADEGLPLGLVRALVPVGDDVMLVGHQPTVEELVRALVHPVRPSLSAGFRTAMVVTLELAPRPSGDDRWQLVAVLDPHHAP